MAVVSLCLSVVCVWFSLLALCIKKLICKASFCLLIFRYSLLTYIYRGHFIIHHLVDATGVRTDSSPQILGHVRQG